MLTLVSDTGSQQSQDQADLARSMEVSQLFSLHTRWLLRASLCQSLALKKPPRCVPSGSLLTSPSTSPTLFSSQAWSMLQNSARPPPTPLPSVIWTAKPLQMEPTNPPPPAYSLQKLKSFPNALSAKAGPLTSPSTLASRALVKQSCAITAQGPSLFPAALTTITAFVFGTRGFGLMLEGTSSGPLPTLLLIALALPGLLRG